MDRIWLWPNLLSLDAPVVALAWQLLFARCFHVAVKPLPSILLTLAVWLIYAADRTLDALREAKGTARCVHRSSSVGTAAPVDWGHSRLSPSRPPLRPRHEFYRRHWRALLPLWIGALAAGAALAYTRLDRALFYQGCFLGAAVAGYFALVHLRALHRTKEAAVAVLFALGATLSAWPNVHTAADVASIALFSCLCWINCVAIEQWESRSAWPVAGASAMVAVSAAPLAFSGRPVLGAAVAASALCFWLLDRSRARFSSDALRVLADVALLSPLFLLPLAGIRA